MQMPPDSLDRAGLRRILRQGLQDYLAGVASAGSRVPAPDGTRLGSRLVRASAAASASYNDGMSDQQPNARDPWVPVFFWCLPAAIAVGSIARLPNWL